MRSSPWLIALAGILASGCQAPAPHNPNDPNAVSAARQPGVVKAYLKQMSDDVIAPAVLANQITEAQGKKMMVEGAQDYLKKVRFKDTPPELLWMVAESYMAAQDWERAKALILRAQKVDVTADRKVNDTLWLAHCQAELGDVDDAIKTARSTFSTPPEWKWPILYAVYLEIVPAAERTKASARIELAHLVEDAIKQHEAATGSLDDKARHDWIQARPFHINRAWNLVVKLYTDANRPDLARAAAAKATKPPAALSGASIRA